MSLKFYLNKFVKCDNIEHYTLRTLEELRACYDEFIKKTGSDPDFPSMNMGGDGSINIGASQLSSFVEGEEEDSSAPQKNNK